MMLFKFILVQILRSISDSMVEVEQICHVENGMNVKIEEAPLGPVTVLADDLRRQIKA